MIDDAHLQAMLREMKAMPPPLTAIVTPRVDLSSHMGNMARLGMPKYSFSSMLPPLMKPLDSPPQSLKVKKATQKMRQNQIKLEGEHIVVNIGETCNNRIFM
jgi:hypothetical protein